MLQLLYDTIRRFVILKNIYYGVALYVSVLSRRNRRIRCNAGICCELEERQMFFVDCCYIQVQFKFLCWLDCRRVFGGCRFLRNMD